MVFSDIAFYSVLIWAIAVTLIFIMMMWKLKAMFSPLMMKILTTLHASLFGYETAMLDLIGPRGYRTHVFPKIVEIMNTLKGESEMILDVFDAKSPGEAMKRWMDVMIAAKIVKEGEIIENDDGTYTISIKECSMHQPIHEVMGQQKGICPFALIISAASSIVGEDLEPQIKYSIFNPKGTETQIALTQKGTA